MARWRGVLLCAAVACAAPSAPAEGERERAVAAMQAGLAAEKRQEYPAAIRLYGEAAGLYQAVGDKAWQAAALYRKGVALWRLGQWTEALGATEAALALCRETGQRPGECAALHGLGSIYSDIGRYAAAVGAFQQSLKIARELADRGSEATTLHGLAMVHKRLGRYEEALAGYQQSLTIFRAIGDQRGKAAALAGLAGVCLRLGRLDEALDACRQSLQIVGEVGDREGEAESLLVLAGVYYRLSRYDAAIAAYQQSLKIDRALGNRRGEAAALVGLANIHSDLARYDEALAAYAQSLKLDRETGNRQGEAAALLGRGTVLWRRGRLNEAIDAICQSMDINREIRNHHGLAGGYLILADVCIDARRYEDAFKACEASIAIHRAIGARAGEAVALLSLAGVCDELGRYDEGSAAYWVCLRTFRALGDRANEANALNNLMFARRRQRLLASAAAYGKQAVAIHESLRGDVRSLAREMQKGLLRRQRDTHTELAAALLALSRHAEALQILDLGRDEDLFVHAGRLADRPAKQVSFTPLEAHWIARANDVSDRLAKLEGQRARLRSYKLLTDDEQKRLTELEAQIKPLEAEHDRTMKEMEVAFTGPAPVGESIEPPECGAFRKQLGQLSAGVAAVYTATVADAVWALVVTADGYRSASTKLDLGALDQQIAALRTAVANPRVSPRNAGQALHNVLLKPIEPDLQRAGIRTLLWSLDGQLRYVPVNALWDGRHYLIERYLSVNITPLSKAHLLDQPAGKWSGVGLGVSKPHAPFAALPFVADELRGILGPVVPGESALDEQFTASTLQAALARRPQVVHIATHFVAGRTAADSKLLLGDGSTLSLADIAQWNKAFEGVQLLALSACETAIGKEDSSGVEVDALGAVAQQQGARAVLASLWPVADASTSALMQEFYRRRQADPALGKGEAFRQAQLALLRGEIAPTAEQMERRRGLRMGAETLDEPAGTGPPYTPAAKAPFAHPFYWAPFVLTGNFR